MFNGFPWDLLACSMDILRICWDFQWISLGFGWSCNGFPWDFWYVVFHWLISGLIRGLSAVVSMPPGVFFWRFLVPGGYENGGRLIRWTGLRRWFSGWSADPSWMVLPRPYLSFCIVSYEVHLRGLSGGLSLIKAYRADKGADKTNTQVDKATALSV